MATTGSSGATNNLDNAGKLCWHIRPFASGWNEGTLNRLTRWFVGEHVSRCRSCQKALAALAALTRQLRSLGATPVTESLASSRWTELDAAWADAERSRAAPRRRYFWFKETK